MHPPTQDHHCAVIDRCVGSANGLYFVGYAASTCGACLAFCLLAQTAADHWHWSILLRFAWWDFAVCGVVAAMLATKHIRVLLKPPQACSSDAVE